MADLLQITTTTASRETAERIAAELLAQRLAACVQISGPIASIYHWQGNMENSAEWLCVAKSSREQLAGIEEVLRQLHPYEVPELIATPIVGGSDAYLKWLAGELAAEPTADDARPNDLSTDE